MQLKYTLSIHKKTLTTAIILCYTNKKLKIQLVLGFFVILTVNNKVIAVSYQLSAKILKTKKAFEFIL